MTKRAKATPGSLLPVTNFDPKLAKSSCKTCYGTGVYGTLVEKDGTRVRLVCKCVAKALRASSAAK